MTITEFIEHQIKTTSENLSASETETLTNFLYGGYTNLPSPCVPAYNTLIAKISGHVTGEYPTVPAYVRAGITDDILFGLLDRLEDELM